MWTTRKRLQKRKNSPSVERDSRLASIGTYIANTAHEYPRAPSQRPIEYFGVAVHRSAAVFTSEEAIAATETLGSPIWVVKSQIHVGRRDASWFQDGPQTIRQ